MKESGVARYATLIAVLLILLFLAGSHWSPAPRLPQSHTAAEETKKREAVESKTEDSCVLSPACDNGVYPYWAQETIDADLMQFKLKQMGITTDANVAVVDSGLDEKQTAHIEVKSLKMEKGSEKLGHAVGNPKIDQSGHGTMVTGVIAGKDKLGIARDIHFASYRVTKEGEGGSTTSDTLRAGIQRACDDNLDPGGLTIINVSWGSRADEAGFSRDEDEKAMQKLFEDFSKKGCLIVKAAGNDGFRASVKSSLDDPYLRVAAIDPSLELAGFSTAGEVGAPGGSIYTLESTTAAHKAPKEKRCSKTSQDDESSSSPRRFVNGTSFAAPMTAAVASQVVRVLKSKPKFSAIEPKDRIKLVNRILKASSQRSSINALRAVVLADEWNRAGEDIQAKSLTAEGVSTLETLLASHSDAVCNKTAFPCGSHRECPTVRSCVNLARAQAALCPVSAEHHRKLVQLAFQAGGFEIGYKHLERVEALSPEEAPGLRKTAVKRYFERKKIKPTFENISLDKPYFYNPFREIDLNFAKTIVAPYLEDYSKGKNNNESFATALALGFLESSDIKESLSMGVDPETGEDRGSNQTLETVVSVLKSSRASLGEARFKKLLQNYVIRSMKKMDQDEESYKNLVELLGTPDASPVARILQRLISEEPADSKLRSELLALETELLEYLEKKNHYYAEHTAKFVILSELYPTRLLFDGMMERNFNRIETAVKEKRVNSLSPLQTHYLLRNLHRLRDTQHEQSRLALTVLDRVGTGKGWSRKNDLELFDKGLLELERLHNEMNEGDRKKLKENFHILISRIESPEIAAKLLDGYWSKERVGQREFDSIFFTGKRNETGITYRDLKLFDRDVLRALSEKMSHLVSTIEPEKIGELRRYEKAFVGMGVAWRGLMLDSSRKLEPTTGLRPPTTLTTETSRLKPPTGEATKIDGASGSEALVQYFKGMQRLIEHEKSNENTNEMLSRGFNFMYNSWERDPVLKEVFENLMNDSQWIAAAEALTNANAKGSRTGTWSVGTLVRDIRVEKQKRRLAKESALR